MKKHLLFLCCLLAWLPMAAQDNVTVFYQSAEWSPDGKQLCFAAVMIKDKKFEKNSWELYTINTDGTGLRRITQNNWDDVWPSWSPDGKGITFDSNRDGNYEIYRSTPGGENPMRLTNNTYDDFQPAFAPDGKKIVFVSKRDGNQDLYTINTDGSGEARLTSSEFSENNPTWSPSGKQIAYFYEKGDRKDQLYVIELEGLQARNISNDTLNNVFPSWRKHHGILFSTQRALYTIHADGHGKTLAAGGAFIGRFSPDGSQLCMIKKGWPESEIYIAAPDGTNARLLVKKEEMIGLKK